MIRTLGALHRNSMESGLDAAAALADAHRRLAALGADAAWRFAAQARADIDELRHADDIGTFMALSLKQAAPAAAMLFDYANAVAAIVADTGDAIGGRKAATAARDG